MSSQHRENPGEAPKPAFQIKAFYWNDTNAGRNASAPAGIGAEVVRYKSQIIRSSVLSPVQV